MLSVVFPSAFFRFNFMFFYINSCYPMNYTVHGILKPRILEWVAAFSRGSSQPRNRTQVSRIVSGFFMPAEPQGKPGKGVTKLSNQFSNFGGKCCHTSTLHILPESPLLLFGFMSKRILRQKRLHSAVPGSSTNRRTSS